MNRHAFFFLPLVAGFLSSYPVAAQIQLQPLWALDPGVRPYVPGYPGDNGQRGLAYDPTTGNVLLVNRTGGLSVNVMDGTTGADKGSLDTTGISGGTFSLNQIAVASDGAIYAANLVSPSSSSSPFKIYRWANQSATPTVVYSGEPLPGTRWGDNIQIRGSGDTTQILFGQGGSGVGNSVAVFLTADHGASFTPTTMTVSGLAAGGTRGGVAFGQGNTFYTKNAGDTTLYYATFDFASSSASVTDTITLPAGLSGFGALDTLLSNNLLAGIQVNTSANPQTLPQNVYLFDISYANYPIPLDVEPFINPGIQNLNAAGAVDFGGGKLFALDANNGVRAYDLIPEPSTWALLSFGLACVLYGVRRSRSAVR